MLTLAHYGVEGMKWGVRKYQNKDGSLTPEGKEHANQQRKIRRYSSHVDDVNEIADSLSKKDRAFLGIPNGEKYFEKQYLNEDLACTVALFVQKQNSKPVSFIQLNTFDSDGRVANLALATRSGEEYRGKGYASKNVSKAIDYVNRYGNKSIEEIQWWADKGNTASNNLAKKHGFTQVDSGEYDAWNKYVYKRKQPGGRD